MPKYGDYPSAGPLSGNEIVLVKDGSTTRRTTAQTIANLGGGEGGGGAADGYTRIIDAVRDLGCDPTGAVACNDLVQTCYDENAGTQGGTLLYFPSGIYLFDAPIELGVDTDFDAKFTIRGHGRRSVEIFAASDATHGLISMNNAGQNLRGIVIEDITLRWGGRQLYMRACVYNLFRNVTFWAGGAGAVHQVVLESGSSNNVFDNCWWVHGNAVGEALSIASGQAYFDHCIFGEDCGNLSIADNARFSGCKFQFTQDRGGGHQSMGKAMFTVIGGSLTVVNSDLWVTTNLVNMDQPKRVKFVGNDIYGGTGVLLKLRGRTVPHPIIFSDNHVRWIASGTFYDDMLAVHPLDSNFIGNAFEVNTGQTVTMDDALLAPENRNTWRDNSWRNGSL